MPLVPLHLRPGINSLGTPTLNSGGYEESNAGIRFFQGYLQKDGGFVKFTQTLPNAGRPLWMHAWSTLAGVRYLAIACSRRINLFGLGVVTDITPDTTAPATIPVSLSATVGSSIITVEDPVSAPNVGDVVVFDQPIAIAGLVLGPNGGVPALPSYSITTIVDATHYQFDALIQASVGIINGGQVRTFSSTIGSSVIRAILPNHGLLSGQSVLILLTTVVGGVTVSPGTYQVTVDSPSSYTIDLTTQIATVSETVSENGGNLNLFFYGGGSAQNDILASGYTLTNWGEFLLACPTGGPLFVWMPATGQTTLVATAPRASTGIFIASAEQILFCFGTIDEVTGKFDPMLVRWSDIGDYTNFVTTTTDQAGSYRLSIGSRIVGAIAFSSNAFIWTDTAVYSVQYIQFPLIWGFQPIDTGCGLIALHAMIVLREQVFWMGQNQFFTIGPNGVQMIPCPVWDQVFGKLDRANDYKCICAANSFFNEIRWFFPSTSGNGEIDSFVRWQIDAGADGWSYGSLQRVAWIDQSVFGAPIGVDEGGIVYQHEVGNDADTEPLGASVTTGIIQIADGDETVFIREIIPDLEWENGQTGPGVVNFEILMYDYPQDPPRVKGPFPVTSSTRSIRARGRARGLQFKIYSNDLGSFWRLGLPKYRGHPDGRR